MNASGLFTIAAATCSILAILCTLAATHFSKAESAQKAADAAVLVQKQHQAQLDAVRGEATGGESYPYAEIYLFGRNTFKLMLHRKGEFTLYDISLTLRDQNRVEALPLQKLFGQDQRMALAALDACDQRVSIGNLGRGGGGTSSLTVELATFTIPENISSFSYIVSTIARNGSWNQRIGAKKINGEWQIGSHLEGSHVVEKNTQLSAKFPLKPNGDPDFDAEPLGPRPPKSGD